MSDPGLPPDFTNQFPSLTRLPLYICWTCVAATYRVTSDSMIRTEEYRNIEFLKDFESPYHEAPDEVEQERFALHQVPTCVDTLSCHLQDYDDQARTILDQFTDITGTGNFSTVGAHLVPPSGRRPQVCPHSKCPVSRFENAECFSNLENLMKELALIDGDGSTLLSQHGLWLKYHICCICSTIVGEYGCS